jgi:hypothetical protein
MIPRHHVVRLIIEKKGHSRSGGNTAGKQKIVSIPSHGGCHDVFHRPE